MADTLKKVRFKLSWQQFCVGDVITPNGALRDWLLANGYVDVVDANAAPVNRQINGKSIQKRQPSAAEALFK